MIEKYPSLRVLLVVSAGIGISLLCAFSFFFLVIASASSLGLSMLCLCAPPGRPIAFYTCLLSSGLCLGSFAVTETIELHHPRPTFIKGSIQGVVLRSSRLDSTSIRCLVQGTVYLQHIVPHKAVVQLVLQSGMAMETPMIGRVLYCDADFYAPMSALLPSEFPQKRYCAGHGIRWVARSYRHTWALLQQTQSIWTWVDFRRQELFSTIDKLFWNEQRGLVKGLVFGDTKEVSSDVSQLFARSGTAHVLAVSGLHVAIFAAIIAVLVASIALPWLRFSVHVACISFYVILCGCEPSALRAACMYFAFLGTRLHQRRSKILNTLCLTILVLIISEPQRIHSIGFQLSASAVAGIALLYQDVHGFLASVCGQFYKRLSSIVRPIALSLSASSLSAPIIALYFHNFSFISPLSNLVVVPLTSLASLTSMLAISLTPLSHFLAHCLAAFAATLLELCTNVNALCISLPYSYVESMYAMDIALLFSLTLYYVSRSAKKRSVAFRLCCCLLMSSCYLWFRAQEPLVQNIEDTKLKACITRISPNADLVELSAIDNRRIILSDVGLIDYLRMRNNDSIVIVMRSPSLRNLVPQLRCGLDNKYLYIFSL